MRPSWKLTPQQRLHVLRLYKKGEKLAYIAALYNITQCYVTLLAARNGVPRERCIRHAKGA